MASRSTAAPIAPASRSSLADPPRRDGARRRARRRLVHGTMTALQGSKRHGESLPYVVFDVPYLAGVDIRRLSWTERLELLAEAFDAPIALSPLVEPSVDLVDQMVAGDLGPSSSRIRCRRTATAAARVGGRSRTAAGTSARRGASRGGESGSPADRSARESVRVALSDAASGAGFDDLEYRVAALVVRGDDKRVDRPAVLRLPPVATQRKTKRDGAL